jgi:hypothetical protein
MLIAYIQDTHAVHAQQTNDPEHALQIHSIPAQHNEILS